MNGDLPANSISVGIGSLALGWRELTTQKGDTVWFCISDAFLPSADELGVFATDEKVEGTVIDFSDSGPKPAYFAVIDVIRRHTVVVPVEKVGIVPGKPGNVRD